MYNFLYFKKRTKFTQEKILFMFNEDLYRSPCPIHLCLFHRAINSPFPPRVKKSKAQSVA